MSWALNLPNDATVTVGRGTIQVRRQDGSLVTYKPPAFGALVIGPLTEKGRRMTLRSQ